SDSDSEGRAFESHQAYQKDRPIFQQTGLSFSMLKSDFCLIFRLIVEYKPTYAQVLCVVANINLTINEFKKKMGQCMAIPYGFEKMADGNVRMVARRLK
ncbi:MAG: hypothetical protein RR413_08815, partial [Christensenellaceae bacterium]